MRKGLIWAAAGMMLAGCGGGSDGGGSANAPVAAQPAPAPVTTPPPPPPPAPPAPAVSVTSGTITRQIAANTGIVMEVTVKPNFTPAGTLYASAADNVTLLAPGVAVTPNSDGTYTLAIATLPAVESGNYSGEFTIKLCSDGACTSPQAVPSVKVPYALSVSAAGAA